MGLALHEEYLKRNKLKIPIIHYRKKTDVFLVSKNSFDKRILSISWNEQERHPGFFQINYNNVIFDSCNHFSMFSSVLDEPIYLNWDQYESNILNLVSSIKSDGFMCIEERNKIFAAWEFFLHVSDTWLSKNLNKSFLVTVCLTLQKDLDFGIRENYINSCILFLKKEFNHMYEIWLYHFYNICKTKETDWLVKLINE